jgi:hypothetical protein
MTQAPAAAATPASNIGGKVLTKTVFLARLQQLPARSIKEVYDDTSDHHEQDDFPKRHIPETIPRDRENLCNGPLPYGLNKAKNRCESLLQKLQQLVDKLHVLAPFHISSWSRLYQ